MNFAIITAPVAPSQFEYLLVYNHITVENYSVSDIILYNNKNPIAIIQANTSKTFLDVKPFKTNPDENQYIQNPLGLDKVFFQSQTGVPATNVHVYNYGVKF